MKIGLFGVNMGPWADPGVATKLAQRAETAGFESLWTGEHVVLPDPQQPPSPSPPLVPFLHPSTALSYLAATTSTIKLGTGITLLAQRNALVLAKEMASLDVLSNGRLLFGIGAGYLKAEFDALGVNFAERGARTDEYIEALREIWTSDTPQFSGRFVNFSGIQSRPKPAQAGGPPIILGGMSQPALVRAVRRCEGWYGFALDLDATAKAVKSLEQLAHEHERPEHLGQLEISVTPALRVGPDELKRFEDLGVDRLILLQAGSNEEELLAYIDQTANALLA